MINWKVRIRNLNFWVTLIPMLVVLATAVLAPLGVTWDFEGIGSYAISVVTALFGVLAFLGFVNDPTTEGFGDSAQAMTYEQPKAKHLKGGE